VRSRGDSSLTKRTTDLGLRLSREPPPSNLRRNSPATAATPLPLRPPSLPRLLDGPGCHQSPRQAQSLLVESSEPAAGSGGMRWALKSCHPLEAVQVIRVPRPSHHQPQVLETPKRRVSQGQNSSVSAIGRGWARKYGSPTPPDSSGGSPLRLLQAGRAWKPVKAML
jgi:hypothetical protein